MDILKVNDMMYDFCKDCHLLNLCEKYDVELRFIGSDRVEVIETVYHGGILTAMYNRYGLQIREATRNIFISQ